MNEPYRIRVMRGCRISRILLACFTALFFQMQVLSVYASDDPLYQQRTISGTVTDETGSPFPFVTVYVDGNTTIGSITDEKGEYRLTVPQGSTLCFAFVGYKTLKFPLTASDVMDVKMEPEMKALDEVVVVGFGEQRRASVSAAVTTISADEIIQSPVANITNALAGRLPGLTTIQTGGQPGLDAAALYIRGRGTWNNADPLYVIDGVERTSAIFQTMDPSEVESFTVLKDAAATAVYGTKGANGVVLINTKRGQEGTTTVSINSSVTLQQFTRYPRFLDSYESLKLYNEALMNDGLDPVYSEYDLEMYRTGADPYRYPNTDWYELMMKKVAPQYRTSVNLRGGSRTVRYFVSASYMRQEGQLKTQPGRIYNPRFAYDNYRFTSNVDAIITNAFTLTFELAGNLSDRSDPWEQMGIFHNMNRLGPWVIPATNPDGSYAGNSEFPDFNPLYLIQTRGNDTRLNNSITSAIKLAFNLDKYVKGLSINGRVAYDSNFGYYKGWSETQSTFQLISRPGRADRYTSYLTPSFFSPSYSTMTAQRTVDALGNIVYNRRFGDHSLRIQGVANISEYRTGTAIPYNSVSFIARANYGYKNKYNLEANTAYRGSENFAPGRRFGLFPSVSLSWNIQEESFMQSLTMINVAKLRASYGRSGSDYAGTRFIYKEGKWTTNTTTRAYFGEELGASLGGSYEPDIANPLATWETAEQINLGFDLVVFRNRLSMSFDRFFERRTGILQTPRSVPGILGIGTPDLNIGETSREGWEYDVTYRHELASRVVLTLRPNIAYSVNKVVFRDEPEDADWWSKQEGKPIGQFMGYQVLGFFKDQADIDNSPVQQVGSTPIPGDFKYMDYNGDGVVNEYDRVPIGYTTMPRFTFGTTLGMNIGNVNFSVHFQGAAQSSIYVSQMLMWEFYNRSKVQEHHLERWTPTTHETATYPALHIGAISQNHVQNSFFIQDNTYLRLKTAEIGYTIPSTLIRRVGLKGLRLYLSGTNLLTWDRFKVLDPEVRSGTTTQWYPQSRNYSFGFNLNF
ncbi:MAG: TonB-dependent receptor [Bacteroidales bacterium]